MDDPLAPLLSRRGCFEVLIAGEGELSPLAGVRSAYCEWGVGIRKSDQIRSHVQGYRSRRSIEVVVDGRSFLLEPDRTRLYLRPAFERQGLPADPSLPPPAAALVTGVYPEGALLWVAEYALEIGKKYSAKGAVETYSLPPFLVFPRRRKRRVLMISDRDIGETGPGGDPIPGSRGITG